MPAVAQADMPEGFQPGQMPDISSMPQVIPPAGMFPESGEADPKVKTVWLKDDKGDVHPQMVVLGIENGSKVEITSGLKVGDEVVISMSGGKKKKSSSRNTVGPRGPMPFGG
jgi:multidrug efflux pump subunit AcrA (membrane-fusion protein)